MSVRNLVGEQFFPWTRVVRIAFPDGSPWAQLILADDETHMVMAIQAMDKQRAVYALRAVRELHARRPSPPVRPAPVRSTAARWAGWRSSTSSASRAAPSAEPSGVAFRTVEPRRNGSGCCEHHQLVPTSRSGRRCSAAGR